MASTSRPYSAAHFALELDNQTDGGLFRSIEGGGIKTDVMTYQQGGIYDRWRQLGKVKFEDLKLQVGMSMSQLFYTWIEDFVAGKATRKDGAVVAADFYYKARARREFKNAMIKELAFPKLEGKDTGPAYLNVTVAVEDIIFQKGDEQALPPGQFDNQKKWTACNFHFSIDDYTIVTDETSKVDAFTIKQTIVEYHQGGRRGPTLTPSAIDFPNLVFYVPKSAAQPLMDYYTNRGVKDAGSDVPGDRLHGSLQIYDDAKSALFELEFFNADIVSCAPDKADSTTEEIKAVKFELYTERMTFKNS